MSERYAADSAIDRRDILHLAVMSLGFLVFCWRFFPNTQDDAYITLRYSKHLVDGYGLAWNPGGPVVEGYTSFLWVVIGAVPHALDLPPFVFVKILSIISGLATIGILYLYPRRFGVSRLATTIGVATVAFSAGFAFITIQGMETTLTALFLLVATAITIDTVRQNGHVTPVRAIILYGCLFLAMLARPDTVFFAAALLATLAAVLLFRFGRGYAIRLTVYGAFLLGLPGVVYLLWKYLYFGAVLPNPFHVKESTGLVSFLGGYYVLTFITVVLGPVVYLAFYRLLAEDERGTLYRVLPPAVGVLGFLTLWFFIEPMSGFLWRFQMPVLPAAILTAVMVFETIDFLPERVQVSSGRNLRVVVAILVVLAFIAVPLTSYREATNHHETGAPEETVGSALNAYEADSYAMFVTEGGALPYYSGWRAMDEWGLNSKHVGEQGLSVGYVEEFDPDLVMLAVTLQPGMVDSKSPVLATFMDGSSFELVAVIAPDATHAHLYFVDTKSAGYEDISCSIRGLDDVTYVDPNRIEPLLVIDTARSSSSTLTC